MRGGEREGAGEKGGNPQETLHNFKPFSFTSFKALNPLGAAAGQKRLYHLVLIFFSSSSHLANPRWLHPQHSGGCLCHKATVAWGEGRGERLATDKLVAGLHPLVQAPDTPYQLLRRRGWGPPSVFHLLL